MSEMSGLSLKIPLELKEKIKAAALENNHSISTEVSIRLAQSFEPAVETEKPAVHSDAVDSQNTEEKTENPLTSKELKKIRQLLKEKGSAKKK
ncbi:Arc family DNA-binding protein [Affinibrenneria salicis]|uniref:Arc family DNA-binding protein n=1 Tax=Affinibrenneria salicis TaxID=2590031 RepID=A0A5J5G376_9GAMM|nr:Arc family DNA-binding protein [Affinibrenneria salicis]KAA9001180.1 Arc family DNA-binding protein [Affinibrenneria salicis]